ncbi:hypothetical protein ACO2Q3_19095 [Caulobacter sp. KR2-114]|uniref:hypothetical protein n=1 Tax=Caulobacter sp. KR2-114 TaxID=3400912 RepID=UPI003C11F5D3
MGFIRHPTMRWGKAWAAIADTADKVSTGADLTAMGAGALALAGAPTGPFDVPVVAVAGVAELVNLGSSAVSVGANLLAGRPQHATLGAIGIAIGQGSGVASKVLPGAVNLSRKGLSFVLGKGVDSMCGY